MNAKTLMAIGPVAAGTGCQCAVCGSSPFAPAGPTMEVLGGNFTNFVALADVTAREVCAGCAKLLGGKPGDDPPPLRCTSVLIRNGNRQVLRNADIWGVLTSPPSGEFVLSWATSKQVHHWLYAGVSTAANMAIGSDHATIRFVPATDGRLLDAVHRLLYSPTGTAPLFTRASIASGDYHPSAIAKFGRDAWAALESVVVPYRPSPLLELLSVAAPISTEPPAQQETMIDPADQEAGALLAKIACASAVRSNDGKMFWGGFFRHRIERFRQLPLAKFASRMMDACACDPVRSQPVVMQIAGLSDEQTSAVERSVRDRAALVAAICYDLIQSSRVGGSTA